MVLFVDISVTKKRDFSNLCIKVQSMVSKALSISKLSKKQTKLLWSWYAIKSYIKQMWSLTRKLFSTTSDDSTVSISVAINFEPFYL